MRNYLILLVFVIMGAGARTMFEIAHHALGREHSFAPDADTTFLIMLAIWFMLMMVFAILLLMNKNWKGHLWYVIGLSVGVFAPTIYMAIIH